MSEAPEFIVASVDWESIFGRKMTMACVTVGTEGVPSPFEPTHYIRKDVSDARVKQAREDALREALRRIADLKRGHSEDVDEGHEQAYRTIEALITKDAE